MIKVKPFNECCITGQETKVWVEASDILYFSDKAYHVQTLMQLNDPFECQEQKLCFKTLYLCLTLEHLQICNLYFFKLTFCLFRPCLEKPWCSMRWVKLTSPSKSSFSVWLWMRAFPVLKDIWRRYTRLAYVMVYLLLLSVRPAC